MARGMNRLTAKTVERLTKAGYHADGGNLFLVIKGAGAKSWAFRYSRDGRTREMGLGPAVDVTLAEARDRASDLRRSLANGVDPAEERRAAENAAKVATAKALTFRQCAEEYIEAHRAGWRNAKHAAQWSATLETYAYPVFGDLPVAEVDRDLVLRALKPIWNEKPETASRVRGRIEAVIDRAKALGKFTGENPAAWRGGLSALLPAKAKVRRVEHHAALPFGELPAFMAALRSKQGIAAAALEFAILTATRSGEVRGATWAEFDLEAAVWTVPPSRMKAGREHRVPLTHRARQIIEAQMPETPAKPDPDAFVFASARPGSPLSDMSLTAVLRRMNRDDITAHGFRSTFRDWCGERTSFPREIAESALAHVIQNKAEAAYRRGDALEKRRKLMEAWSTYCASKPANETAIVLSINKVRA